MKLDICLSTSLSESVTFPFFAPNCSLNVPYLPRKKGLNATAPGPYNTSLLLIDRDRFSSPLAPARLHLLFNNGLFRRLGFLGFLGF